MSEQALPATMQALVWEAPRVMTMRTRPLPELMPEEVLLRVAYAGICGSELSGYLGHNALRVPPLVMGHEFSGQVAALGSEAQGINPGLAPGTHVTVNPMVFCRTCAFCRRGQTHLCVNRRLVGAHRPGAFAEYTSVPAWQVVPLPEGLSDREGALSEPVACGVRIAERAGCFAGEPVLIVGAGTIGLVTLQVLRLRGASEVFVVDTNAERREVAAELGARVLDPKQTDVVRHVREATGGVGVAVDAVGRAVTREQCIGAVRAGGSVLLSGLHEESSGMPVADVIRREITLHGTFCYTQANVIEAVGLLASHTIRLDPWVTEAPMAEGGLWFDRLIDAISTAAKVLLIPSMM